MRLRAKAPNEFDAAKLIVAAMEGLDTQQQARAIRFAVETLGLRRDDVLPLPSNVVPPEREKAERHPG